MNYVGSGPGGAIQSGVDQWTPAKGELVRLDLLDHETWIGDLEDALVADGALQWAEVAVSSSEILALLATPKELVAAPGAGKLIEYLGMLLFLDATATAYVESAANLGVKYGDGSGTQVSETIEATGFIDQTADTMIEGKPAASAAKAKTAVENKALVLHNLGAGEYTTGTGVLRAKVAYRVIPTGW